MSALDRAVDWFERRLGLSSCASSAHQLAMAEQWAERASLRFDWRLDPDFIEDDALLTDVEVADGIQVLECRAINAWGRPVGRMAGLVEPEEDQRRVYEAEVALALRLSGVDVDAAYPAGRWTTGVRA